LRPVISNVNENLYLIEVSVHFENDRWPGTPDPRTKPRHQKLVSWNRNPTADRILSFVRGEHLSMTRRSVLLVVPLCSTYIARFGMGCGPRNAIKNLNIQTFATFMELVHQISERMEHAVGFHDVAVLLYLEARFALSVRDRKRLPFPSLPFPSLLFLSLLVSPLPFPSLPCPSLRSFSLPFSPSPFFYSGLASLFI
jgi:hypothetical protein